MNVSLHGIQRALLNGLLQFMFWAKIYEEEYRKF
jgi:hypothetical protein